MSLIRLVIRIADDLILSRSEIVSSSRSSLSSRIISE